MKLFLIPALLVLLITVNMVPAQAQSRIGLMAGPSLGIMTGSFVDDSGFEAGFSGGLLLDFQLGEKWAFVTGIQFIQKGALKVKVPSAGGGTHGFQSAYLQVPILGRVAFALSGGPWHLAPFSGFAIGINVGCKSKDGDRFEFEDECDETTPGGNMKTLEYSIPVGLHFWREFPGGSRFMLEARYEFGLNNVFDQAADAGQSARNNVMRFMFGFALPLNEVSQ